MTSPGVPIAGAAQVGRAPLTWTWGPGTGWPGKPVLVHSAVVGGRQAESGCWDVGERYKTLKL